MFSKICSIHFPSWRWYTFLSHLTTKSKISVRWIKKLVAATGGVENLYNEISCTCVFIYISCVGMWPDATSNVISYNNKTHTLKYFHIVIFTSYKTFTIYKFTIIVCFPGIFYLKILHNPRRICDDNLMRNGCMECFRSEAYCKICRSDKNTESTVYCKY